MKITLEGLKTLEAIERCGTFALAAKELFRVPSALTYTIKNLENEFNEPIFDREGHRATLTPFGKRLLAEGKNLLTAADRLEKNLKIYQTGWEDIITIVYDRVIPFKNLNFLIESFYQDCPNVELKITGEILGGCWDALLTNRAMLSIGVSGEPPIREDISMMHLGTIEFAFLVSATHPLASIDKKINNSMISQYRSIAVADTSRGFMPRTSGILPDQKTLTVSNFEEKVEAMLNGLGIGYLPLTIAQPYIDSGKLVVKKIDKLKSKGTLSSAWRPSHSGKGMQWFIDKLSDEAVTKRILIGPSQSHKPR